MNKISKQSWLLFLTYSLFLISFSSAEIDFTQCEYSYSLEENAQGTIDQYPSYLILDKRVANENTGPDHIIAICKNQLIRIKLNKSLVEFSYDPRQDDYICHNPWKLQQEGTSLTLIPGLWEDGAIFTSWPTWSPRNYQQVGIAYEFRASSGGLTTLTFTRKSSLYKETKQLTFKINVVEAATQTLQETSQ